MAAAHGSLRILSKSNKTFLNCRFSSLNNDLSKQICFSRLKSTSATVVTAETAVSSDQEKFQKDELDLTFENTKDAYKSKTTWELTRAFMVLKLTSIDYLVENNQKLLKVGRKILGPTLFNILMKSTFYGHFVAGENEHEIQPVIKRMHSFGVKSILDYSAEEDISEEQAQKAEMSGLLSSASEDGKLGEMKEYQPYEKFADRRKHHTVARTYFYMNEAQCEKNMETFIKCINAVAGTTQSTGFAAIKLTALGRPQLLMQLSEVIAQTRRFFKNVAGTERNMALVNVSPEFLEHKLEDYNINTEKKEVQAFFEHMDYDKKGYIFFQWTKNISKSSLISK